MVLRRRSLRDRSGEEVQQSQKEEEKEIEQQQERDQTWCLFFGNSDSV